MAFSLPLLAFLFRFLLRLLEEPIHRRLYTLIQTHNRGIPQPLLRLPNIVIPRHRAISHLSPRQLRLLPNKPHRPLHRSPKRQPYIFRDDPDVFRAQGGSAIFPYQPCKVPEIDRGVVRDEEGFPVHFLVIEGFRRSCISHEKRSSSE